MSVAFKPVAGDVKASVEVLLWASSRPSSAWNHTSSSSLTGSSVRTTSLSTNLCMSFLSGIREHCIKSKKKVTSFRIPYLNLSYRKTFFTWHERYHATSQVLVPLFSDCYNMQNERCCGQMMILDSMRWKLRFWLLWNWK